MAEKDKKKTTTKESKTKKSTKKSISLTVDNETVSASPKKKSTKKNPAKAKKTPAKKIVSESAFVRDPIPSDENYDDNQTPGTGIFMTLVTLLVVAGAVLAGYVYAQKNRMEQTPMPPAPIVAPAPQRVSVSSSVALSPEIVASLESIVDMVTLSSDDVLEDVRRITDVAAAQKESPVFMSSVQSGDVVYEFRTLRVLYRPVTREVIKSENVSDQ